MAGKYQVMGFPPGDGPMKGDYPLFATKSEAEKFAEAAKREHPDWTFSVEERPDLQ